MSKAISRRAVLRGSVAAAALAFTQRPLEAFGFEPLAEGEELIRFAQRQPRNPNRPMVNWEELADWLTPLEDLYIVSHYDTPKLDEAGHRLRISGLVGNELELSLAELRRRPRRTTLATLECGGNGASIAFMGAVGNQKWTGTPLAPILREADIKPEGIEIVFWGADEKTEKIRDKEFDMKFARSLSVGDALRDDLLLAWEVDGQPLPVKHGFPLRLVVPGWYGIAWVKWLTRIEVLDRRYMGRFMGRDYVTIRGEEIDGEVLWRETSVTRMNVKSITARVVRQQDRSLRISGAAWTDGTPLKTVEVRIDDGPWQPAKIHQDEKAKFSWSFWDLEWQNPSPGEHTIVSRATDAKGNIQPAKTDPPIELKKTFWEANQQVVRKIKV